MGWASHTLCLALLCSVICTSLGSRSGPLPKSKEHEWRARSIHQREVLSLPYTSYPELTTSVSGTLYNLANSSQSYVIKLAAGQVANLFTTTDYQYSGGYFYATIYQVGTDNSRSTYFDYSSGINNLTLANHCPVSATTYFFTVTASAAFNYTIAIQKVAVPTITTGTINRSGKAYGLPDYKIAIPTATKCSTLAVSARGTDSWDLNYNCAQVSSDSSCSGIGLYPNVEVSRYDSAAGQYIYDFYVNCTQVGNYYLTASFNYNGGTYNISVLQTYPCPSWCLGRGTCDFQTATCTCTASHPGEHCGVTTKRTSERAASDTVTDIAVDGNTYNYSNPVILPQGSDDLAMIRLVPSASTSKAIRLVMNVQPRDTYASNFYVYFNPDSKPKTSSPSNYTSYDYVYVYRAGQSSSNTIEVFLCSSVSAWYIGLREQSYPQFPIPNVNITATYVDIGVTTGTYSGTLSTHQPYSSSYNSLAFQFTAPQTGVAYIRMNEDPLTPYMYGIVGVTTTCGVMSARGGGSYGDTGVFENYYQSTLTVTAGVSYYFTVAGRPGVNFNGRIDFTASRTICEPSSNCNNNGICTFQGTCICKYGFTGSACEQINLGSNYVQLADKVASAVNVPTADLYSNGATQLFLAPILPPFYGMQGTMNATGSNAMYLSFNTFLPNPYAGASLTVYPSSSKMFNLLGSSCLPRVPTQYYFLIEGANSSLPTTGSIQANLINSLILADGNSHTFSGLTTNTYFSFHFDLPTCADAFYVTLTPEPGTTISSSSAGNPYSAQNCNLEVSLTEQDNGGLTGIIPIGYNCSWGIDVRVYVSSGSAFSAKAVATKACPNRCSNRGTCLLGGTCQCYYPYTGESCSLWDANNNIASSLTTCKGEGPIAYQNSMDTNVLQQSYYCDLHYDDAVRIPKSIQSVTKLLSVYKFTLSTSCMTEIKQIFCDYNFMKLQTQAGGGSRMMLPCNAETYVSRCVPGFTRDLADFSGIAEDVEYYINNYQDRYICNPNPGPLGKADPVVTTGQVNGNSGGGAGTTGVDSAASALAYSLVLLLSATLCFIL